MQMYVTAPDTDIYAIPKVDGKLPKNVSASIQNFSPWMTYTIAFYLGSFVAFC